jgi:thymidylate synthase (FAD)
MPDFDNDVNKTQISILDPCFKILTDIDSDKILKNLERIGRNAYKSEHNINEYSAEKFIRTIIALGHESVIEHEIISVRFICDRGISHELVRSRIASYTQESSRYCNYSKDKFNNKIAVIRPFFWNNKVSFYKYKIWEEACENCAKAYFNLLELGASPEEARSVLPNSLKTDVIATMNLRQWRHFLKLRTSQKAHPQMREITIPLLKEFKKLLPIIFDDINV